MFSLQPAVGPTTVANDSGRLILNFFTWYLFLENREKNKKNPRLPLRSVVGSLPWKIRIVIPFVT
jgi:hypothetical protein